MRFATLTYTVISLLCAACVSVSLSQRETKRAKGVTVAVPPQPFAADPRKDVDGAWQNPKNGNLIGYISDCQDDSDPALDNIVQGALGGLTDMKFEKKDSPMMQGREARRVLVSGKVDGVPSQIDMLAFKRDNCIYILSYVGVQKSFADDHAQFDRFVEGFRAP